MGLEKVKDMEFGTAVKLISTISVAYFLGCLSIAYAQAEGDIGAMVYCGEGVEKTSPLRGTIQFPSDMGPPEMWEDTVRLDVLRSVAETSDGSLNIDTQIIPPYILERLKIKSQYYFPCHILKIKSDWKEFWLNDKMAIRRIKRLKRNYEKYMDCLYDHRKEINKLNKKVIEHTCKKRSKWAAPGYKSVAEGVIKD